MPLLLFLISAILAARDYLDFLISNKFRTLARGVTSPSRRHHGNRITVNYLQSEMPPPASAVSVKWWMRLNPHKYFNFLNSGDQPPASSLQTLNGTFTNTNTLHTAPGYTENKYFTVWNWHTIIANNFMIDRHDISIWWHSLSVYLQSQLTI